MSILKRVIALLCLLTGLHTAEARPQRFHQTAAPTKPISGLFGTEIGDIVWSGRYLWAATESGVARLDPEYTTGTSASDWVTFTVLNGLGRGSISALDAVGDTVWVATIIDTTTSIGTRQMGTGLSFSHDAGSTWTHIPNEAIFDPQIPSFERGPGTQIDNGCFGLSVGKDEVWAAFFAGSTVQLSADGTRWRRTLPDGADDIVYFARDTAADSLRIFADSLASTGADPALVSEALAASDSLASQGLLHRTFSVLAYGDTVWVGTSSGLTRSFDGGQTWQNTKVRLNREGTAVPGQIGANWVLSIERQIAADGTSILWVGTNVTGLPGEIASMAYSRDSGTTWTVTGTTFAWDFAFTEGFAWAATSQGLLKRAYDESIWEAVEVSSSESLNGTFVGLETLPSNEGHVLWAGAENGLGRSGDEGANWRIIRDLVRVRTLDTNAFIGEGGVRDSTTVTYAAPNPFSPSAGDRALIVFSLQDDTDVDIDIYDFASRKVRTLASNTRFAGNIDHRVPWDGSDNSGQSVANGTYFYRIQMASGRQAFGKVVVLD